MRVGGAARSSTMSRRSAALPRPRPTKAQRTKAQRDDGIAGMIRNSRLRRVTAVVLLVAGVALMLLSAEVGAGLLTFGLGVALELIGLLLERRGRR